MFRRTTASTLRRDFDGDREARYRGAVSVSWRRQRQQRTADPAPAGRQRERRSPDTQSDWLKLGNGGGRT